MFNFKALTTTYHPRSNIHIPPFTFTTTGKARLSDCGYTLYWVSRPSDSGNRHNYRILPIDEPDSVLTGLEQKNRYAIRSSMRRLMERHAKGVREYSFE